MSQPDQVRSAFSCTWRELTRLSPSLGVRAPETASRHAGRRFGTAFCVVIMLALYQLGTSGLLGIQDGMPAGARGALLGGLAALLLPLLLLWLRSGGLLITDAHKGCGRDEEAVRHPGEVQSPRTCFEQQYLNGSAQQLQAGTCKPIQAAGVRGLP